MKLSSLHITTWLSIFSFLTVFAVGLSAGVTQVDEHQPVLLGIWVLNTELSDDPRPRPDMATTNGEQGRRGRRGGFGVGGGFGGSTGRGGFGGRGRRGGFGGSGGINRPDPENMAKRRAAMQDAIRDLMTAPRRMTIAGTRAEITLTYDDGRIVRLLPDSQEHVGLAGTSMRVTRKTRWDETTLVTDITLKVRQVSLEVNQSYQFRDSEAGRQLIVTSLFHGGPFERLENREFRRVYDAE